VAGALPQTPLGELTALPRPSWFRGFGEGKDGKGRGFRNGWEDCRGGRRKGDGNWSILVILFLHFKP